MFKRHVVIFLILIMSPFPCRTNEIISENSFSRSYDENLICGFVAPSFDYPCSGPWPMRDCSFQCTWYLWNPPEFYKGRVVMLVNPVWEERCSECECAEYIVDYEKAYILLPESAIVHSARQPPPLTLTSLVVSSVFLLALLFLGVQIYRMSKRPGTRT